MTLKNEMEDATEKMNEMTQELHSTQIKVTDYKGTYLNNIYFILHTYIYTCIHIYVCVCKIFTIACFINKHKPLQIRFRN